MSTEDAVRAQVAPLIWRGNPHSVSLAASALKFAALADAGHDVAVPLRRTLRHLADCDPGPDDWLDALRARYSRILLEVRSSRL